MDVQEEQLKLGKRPPAADWGVDNEPGQLSRIRDGQLQQQNVAGEAGDYGAYYRGVCAAIRGEGANPVPAGEALAVMALLDWLATAPARASGWLVRSCLIEAQPGRGCRHNAIAVYCQQPRGLWRFIVRNCAVYSVLY